MSGSPLLRVDNLKVHFPVTAGIVLSKTVATVKAVDGVSFDLHAGETLSLVGESGCGKSTTALAVLRMLELTDGQVIFAGQDISHFSRQQMRPLRPRMQMIYQDPFGSLNPRMTIGQIIGEPIRIHRPKTSRADYQARIRELLDLVGLLPGMADRYPHEFSGGQRQRVGIARALALSPELLICDEAVSALDVSIQAQVINLLMDLQDELNLTYLFISHDLSVVRHVSTRVAVMYLGQIVELNYRDALFSTPQHPYTQKLLQAVPVADPALEYQREPALIAGEVPSARNPPAGCRFHPRCPQATDQCRTAVPEAVPLDADTAFARCWHL